MKKLLSGIILSLAFIIACNDKPHPNLKPGDTFYYTFNKEKDHYVVKAINKHGVIIARVQFPNTIGFFTWEELEDKSFSLDTAGNYGRR